MHSSAYPDKKEAHSAALAKTIDHFEFLKEKKMLQQTQFSVKWQQFFIIWSNSRVNKYQTSSSP